MHQHAPELRTPERHNSEWKGFSLHGFLISGSTFTLFAAMYDHARNSTLELRTMVVW